MLSFLRSIRGIPVSQLCRRLSLQVKRRWLLSPAGALFRRIPETPLPPATDPPEPLFPRRTALVRSAEDGTAQAHLLGRCFALTAPCDWNMTGGAPASHLERLTVHYLEFLEGLDAEQGRDVVLDWIQQNPPWQPAWWQTSWNSYAISIRVPAMLHWLVRCREAIPDDEQTRILGSIARQMRFLVRNLETDIRGNHLIKNIRCLVLASRFLTGAEPAAWGRLGTRLLWQELDAQFLGDGMHFELSPAYHCQVFADLLDCAAVLPADDRQRLVRELSAAAQVIADLAHPDGHISLFSDGGLEMAWSPEACLTAYAKLGGEAPKPRTAFGFEVSGYYGFRRGETFGIFDCGASCADRLPAHGHGDLLAFEWDVQGKRVVVDAGVREYETGPERNWNRSTRAHNTVTVGDRDQCEFIRSFRVGRRAHAVCRAADLTADQFRVVGSYTARSAGQRIEHERTLAADSRSVRIEDSITSAVSEPVVARLLLHHECDAEPAENGDVVIHSRGIRIRLQTESVVRIVRSKWSPNFGSEFETVQLEIEYGMSPCQGAFALQLESENE